MSLSKDPAAWRGMELYARGREKVGTIEDIYLDEETGQPEWALVSNGLFGFKQAFVPLFEARMAHHRVEVPYRKHRIEDAPDVQADGYLSQQDEAMLCRHYGVEPVSSPAEEVAVVTRRRASLPDRSTSDSRTTTPAPTAADPVTDRSVAATDEAITRSEEELNVETAEREAGRARLRKYVVIDEVTQTVPVRREEIRVERLPITDATSSAAGHEPAISEEEHEIVLYEEEAIVEKRVVPKERVRLSKQTHVEELQVSEELRREEIEVDEGVQSRTPAERR